jgi:hypothetical protein
MKLAKFWLLNSLATLSVASTCFAGEPPPRMTAAEAIDGEKELQRIGSMVGRWEGSINVLHDPLVTRRSGGTLRLAIALGEENATVSLTDDDGTNVLDKDSVVRSGEANGSLFVLYAGGSDTFAEYWIFVLTHVDRDFVQASVTRTVHNANAKPENPWRSFSVFGEARLKRTK